MSSKDRFSDALKRGREKAKSQAERIAEQRMQTANFLSEVLNNYADFIKLAMASSDFFKLAVDNEAVIKLSSPESSSPTGYKRLSFEGQDGITLTFDLKVELWSGNSIYDKSSARLSEGASGYHVDIKGALSDDGFVKFSAEDLLASIEVGLSSYSNWYRS